MNALTSRVLAPLTAPTVSTRHTASGQQPQSLQATVNYTHPPASGEQLFSYVYRLPNGDMPSNLSVDAQQVRVQDIHTAQRQFSLQRNGFQLERLQADPDIDWADDAGAPHSPVRPVVCQHPWKIAPGPGLLPGNSTR